MIEGWIFDLMLIPVLLIVFLVTCCNLMTKLRKHYEEEQRKLTLPYHKQNVAVVTIDSPISGVYSTAPPPYTVCDLPPNYEDAIKEGSPSTATKDIPKVHTPPPVSDDSKLQQVSVSS